MHMTNTLLLVVDVWFIEWKSANRGCIRSEEILQIWKSHGKIKKVDQVREG